MVVREGISRFALLALAACRHAPPTAKADAAPHVALSPSATKSAPPRGSASGASSASARLPVTSYDAGTNACKLAYGPVRQPFRGEGALAPSGAGVLVVSQESGVPTVRRVFGEAAADREDAAEPPLSPGPPCAVAGEATVCIDPQGAIHERALDGSGPDVVVARSRPHAPFAAATTPAGVVVAYLTDERTTEGVVRRAYARLDEEPPVLLSDEGSGTTFVDLARRGPKLVALLVDGRAAMTPVHARELAVVGRELHAGPDAVVYVGGGAEPNTRAVLGLDDRGAAYALLPIDGEGGFGMATVRIDDPPRIDEPSTWSRYLAGLDPALVAATQGDRRIRLARLRPLEARPDAPRGVELGEIDDAGAFASFGLVASKGRVKSLAMTADTSGALWLLFTDGAGTWLERRVCP